jgi:hypothetical protein
MHIAHDAAMLCSCICGCRVPAELRMGATCARSKQVCHAWLCAITQWLWVRDCVM